MGGGIDVPSRANRSPYVEATRVELLAGIDALVARGYDLEGADLASLREDFSREGYPEDLFKMTCDFLMGRGWREP